MSTGVATNLHGKTTVDQQVSFTASYNESSEGGNKMVMMMRITSECLIDMSCAWGGGRVLWSLWGACVRFTGGVSYLVWAQLQKSPSRYGGKKPLEPSWMRYIVLDCPSRTCRAMPCLALTPESLPILSTSRILEKAFCVFHTSTLQKNLDAHEKKTNQRGKQH